jgi:hypothetical protein
MQAVVLALPIPGFVGTSSPVQVPVLPSGGYRNPAQRPERTPQQGAKVTNRSRAVSPSPCASREGVTERYT